MDICFEWLCPAFSSSSSFRSWMKQIFSENNLVEKYLTNCQHLWIYKELSWKLINIYLMELQNKLIFFSFHTPLWMVSKSWIRSCHVKVYVQHGIFPIVLNAEQILGNKPALSFRKMLYSFKWEHVHVLLKNFPESLCSVRYGTEIKPGILHNE